MTRPASPRNMGITVIHKPYYYNRPFPPVQPFHVFRLIQKLRIQCAEQSKQRGLRTSKCPAEKNFKFNNIYVA